MYLPDGTRITGDAALLPEDLNCGFSETEIAYIAAAGLAAWDACKGGIYYRYIWPCWRLTRNYNKPERWEIWQDEREHPAPMGRASYIPKAKKENRLARSAYTKTAPQKGATREVQCEHTFKITIPRRAAVRWLRQTVQALSTEEQVTPFGLFCRAATPRVSAAAFYVTQGESVVGSC